MRITFLGTNGWYDSETGNTTCTLIETRDRYIVLDAGNGLRRLDKFMTRQMPVDMFLSHFHLDHIEGLHTLVKFVFMPSLRIFGQPGTEKTLDMFVNEPYTVPLARLPYPARSFDLKEGDNDVGYPVECLPLVHASPCYGFRFQLEGKTIAYCTDTGPCDNLLHLARDADLLIAECAFRSGETSSSWPHLNPEIAIDLAMKARCKHLALTHFDAHRYPDLRLREEILLRRDEFPNLTVAFDERHLDL